MTAPKSVEPRTKQCSQCKRVLPVDAFHRRRHYVRKGVRAACKECTAKTAKEAGFKPAEPAKERVRRKTRSLVERGELAPQPCEDCGTPNVQAHHPDYESEGAPKTVEWFCATCHAARHGKRPWTKQMDLLNWVRVKGAPKEP